jgi:polyisoprenyl-phosphate glycosyltransferase
MTVTVLMPIYNDWSAVSTVLLELERELRSQNRTASVVLIDDGSSQLPDFGNPPVASSSLTAVTSIDVVHLRRNLGHQRAIAIGLAFLNDRDGSDAVVVMDGDGEDLPADVNRLLAALGQDSSRIVFAERTRRSEGAVFTALYWAYRVIHRVLTGERVRVGNFSVIPKHLLRNLVAVSELWNHYAAAVFHARLPFTTIPTRRGTRYAGQSQMNFVAMVTHGLSAMSVFGDRIGVRLLFVASAITAAAIAGAVGFGAWHMATGAALSAWSVFAGFALLLLIFLMLATSLGFVFVILAGRGTAGFLPFRDFAAYISHTVAWLPSHVDVEHPIRRH